MDNEYIMTPEEAVALSNTSNKNLPKIKPKLLPKRERHTMNIGDKITFDMALYNGVPFSKEKDGGVYRWNKKSKSLEVFSKGQHTWITAIGSVLTFSGDLFVAEYPKVWKSCSAKEAVQAMQQSKNVRCLSGTKYFNVKLEPGGFVYIQEDNRLLTDYLSTRDILMLDWEVYETQI